MSTITNQVIESRPWEWIFSGIGVSGLIILGGYFVKKRNVNVENNVNITAIEVTKIKPKILVIDDRINPIVKLLISEGYDVEEDNGSLKNLKYLENNHYDLILLDFDGVGVDFSKKQGIGVLEHIKKKNPKQKIIAYSNKDWGLEYQEFIQLADGVLGKDAGIAEFKRKIDELLEGNDGN